MSSLKQLQKDFYNNMFHRENTEMFQYLRPSHVTPEFKLNVYRHSIFQNLRNALELIFPAIWKLVGKECADHIAFAFMQEESNLPVTPCLNDWGILFPKFLKDIPELHSFGYLYYVAELEWLKHLSYGAKSYQALDPRKLLQVVENQIETFIFTLNPSLYLYTAPYELKNIFSLIDSPTTKETIDLQIIPCYVLLIRQQHQVMMHWLTQDRFDFFSEIKRGQTLKQAYEHVRKENPEFDLTSALQFMLNNGVIDGGS